MCIVLAFSLVLTGALPAQQAQSPAPAKGASPAFTPQQLDELTAPIALYPDALLAQMLTCSQNYFQLRELSDFLKKNSKLKGSAVQEAAQKEGFETSYVALSTFPDVVQMMAEKEISAGKCSIVPYVNAEPYYDSRYNTINRVRLIGGATVSWSPRFALEGNFTYQHDTRSSVTNLDALNVILHLYFERGYGR